MGGRLYTKTRLPAKEYNKLCLEVSSLIEKHLYSKVIPSYGNKVDFGDMDVLVRHPYEGPSAHEILTSIFGSMYTKNGPVISFPYKDFQLDFILSHEEDFDFSYNYFSFNDMGNLIGRVARNLGFKFGHNGLFYTMTENTHKFAEILVSNDFREAIEFLGYDYASYKKGFPTLKSMFDFIKSSRFFDTNCFQLENRNHVSRVRDAKRTTYMQFLDYIAEDMVVCDTNKESMIYHGFDIFPKFAYDYNLNLFYHNENALLKTKFNGSMVSNITSLSGVALGLFIQNYKSTKDDFREYILNSSQEDIEQDILGFFLTNPNLSVQYPTDNMRI